MALYIGDTKVKLALDGVYYLLKTITSNPEDNINGIRLLSSDNYNLIDSMGAWIFAKEAD